MLSNSERLQTLLDKLRKSNATAKERIKTLIEHIKVIKHGSDAPNGLDNKRSKALWNNRSAWNAPDDDKEMIEIIKKIESFIYQNVGLTGKILTATPVGTCAMT